MTKQLIKMQQYEVYKDSSIEWLGKIPEQWILKKIAHLFLNVGSGTTPSSGNVSFYGGSIPWLQTGDLTDSDINSTSKTVTEKALRVHSTLKKYKPGSLVVAMYGATIGKVGLLSIETTTNQAYCVIEKNSFINMKYVFYLFLGFRKKIISMAYGGGQPNISQDLIKNLRLPFPDKKEQTAIANFLDQKTTQIDHAVAIKEKQITLLKERKQILIQNAVTRGLNPYAPMRDSGVEWIGEIPAHWIVKKVKHVTSKIGSGITPSGGGTTYLDKGIPLLRSQNVHFGKIDMTDVAFISPETHDSMSNSKVKKGDVLLNITGGSIGRCHFVAHGEEMNVNQHVCILRPTQLIHPEYLNGLIASQVDQGQIWFFQQGGGREGLNFQAIKNFFIPLPTTNEQATIVTHITIESGKINKAITVQQQQIEKLKEYKTTLINSAVTGKIKVINQNIEGL